MLSLGGRLRDKGREKAKKRLLSLLFSDVF